MVETLEIVYDESLKMFFRECTIQPGDTLSEICWRYGHVDWNKIYMHDKNKTFREAFSNPNAIAAGPNTPSFFVPLMGAGEGGKSLRGSILEKVILAHITQENSDPLIKVDFKIIENSNPQKVKSLKTTANGNLYIINPVSDNYTLLSLDYELIAKESLTQINRTPRDIKEGMSTGPDKFLDPASRFQLTLTPNQPTEIVAIPVVYITCPMCGTIYKMVTMKEQTTPIQCPLDNYSLSFIADSIRTELHSFTSPTSHSDITDAFALKCRGTIESSVNQGKITVFWDESRFVNPRGEDYTLCGLYNGILDTFEIIGRATWQARSPILGPGRDYSFHATEKGAKASVRQLISAYENEEIRSNEIYPLSEKILQWMTIHESDRDSDSTTQTIRDLQDLHQDIGFHLGRGGVDGSPAADIGYHFVIVEDGSVYEGRPLGIKGAHCGGFNGGNIGIVMAGTFETSSWGTADKPNLFNVDSLRKLVDILASRFNIISVRGHQGRLRQIGSHDKKCPGDLLYEIVKEIQSKYPGIPGKELPENVPKPNE